MSLSSVDGRVLWLLRLMGAASCALVVLILFFLISDSIPALRELGPRLVHDESWHPRELAANGTYGMLPIVIGSLTVTLGAIALAAPLGLGSAIFCQFYAPRPVATVYRRLVELLAGIPSVVYGFWGLAILAPLIAEVLRPPGHSMFAGILVVAVMILPTIALISESALAAVPRATVMGAAALGMGRWSILRSIVLPSARGGILTATILGVARAVGETMAVVMVCGNIVKVPGSVFDSVRTLTANIALEMGYSLGTHRSALFVSGLLLLLTAIGLTLLVAWVERRDPLNGGGGTRG
ncbi:MAG: phosphate ABC transporter permease subunit PstC [Planctomycetota bacterium]|jgi:phosphate transport system permease protein